jgi:hypothetical protein
LKRFTSWAPPADFKFVGHWSRSDGNGGMFVAEAETAAALFEATAAWSDLLEFDIAPVVDIAEGVPIGLRVQGWIDSLT